MSLINDALKRARQAHKKQPAEASTEAPLEPAESGSSNRRPTVVIVAGAIVVLLLGCWLLWQSFFTSQPGPVTLAKTALTNKPSESPKSSVASNLAKPFQAVAKLGAAIQERSQTNAAASSQTAPGQIASTSQVARTTEQRTPGASQTQTNVAATLVKTSEPPSTAPLKTMDQPPRASAVLAQTPKDSLLAAKVADDPQPPPVSRNVTFPPLNLRGIHYRLSKPSVMINNRTLFLGDHVDGVRVVGIERNCVKVELKGATNELFLK